MKARGTLLMALSNKDQLKFHSYKDAKLLMEAIEKRYGENKESKKVQRTLLKQQYENFAASTLETLDQTFDRLQKLISQLEIQGEVIEQEDMNLKLLRSLPSEWKTHALIWRNKAYIETISLDDLYNNLKIYKPELTGSSSTSQNLQNVAFISSNSTNSTSSINEADNTAFGPNSPQLAREDLEQIDPDDLEEMDLHWEMAMLTIRARRFIKRTGKNLDINGQKIGFDRSKVECFNCYKNGYFARECRALKNQENRGREYGRKIVAVENPTENALIAQDGIRGYDWNAVDVAKKATKVDESRVSDNGGQDDQVTRSAFEGLLQQERQTKHINSPNSFNIVVSPVNTVGPSFANTASPSQINAARTPASTNAFEEHPFERFSPFKNVFSLLHVPIVTPINDTGIFGNAFDDAAVEEEVDMNNVVSSYTIPNAPLTRFLKDHPKDQTLVDLPKDKWAIGTKWVFRNKKDERGIMVKNKARLVAQGHTQEEDIYYDEVFAPVARIEAIRLFLAYASFKDFVVYQMDVKSAFLYGKIEEEVYVCQPSGFEDPGFPDKVYKVEKALYGLHQAPKACQEKYVVDILKKFDFTTVKTASTLIEPNKALVKDAEAKDVDLHLYRSMIGSLMYLTTSRPDITFVVCACTKFQVTLKTSHLHVVKRIFRYLKGQPKLGLWYPRDSPFDLEANSDSDYARANLDRKSTTRSFQFLDKRLISWQCKKQTIVANFTTETEYVAATSCYGQVLWIQNQMLDYGFNLMNTKIYIDNKSTIRIVKNLVFYSKTKHLEIRHHFIRDSYEKKLIQVIKIYTDHNIADLLTKAFDVGRFNILVASIGLLNL
uniref:Putative reverse transcriptase, RNA-dependent DNA polymerase n=1 Tax=Tanacetum cinerariifolium TaxID=118510 RepID=A0A6L2KGJ2_TANCI|nr:putative reverse transcriptase, RNA-dependent DNA polymerase [Tanacetum cinerariifolium]